MRLRLLLLAIAGAMPVARAAFAQRDTSGVVRGRITGVGGAAMEAVDVYSPSVGRGTRTNAEGRFVMAGLVTGNIRFVVRRPGWKAIDTTLSVSPGSPTPLDVRLEPIPQGLPTVSITSQDECPNRTREGFECRRRSGIGVFRDSAEITALKPTYVADFLWGVTGLRRVSALNSVTLESTTGWRCLRTLIDGRLPVRGDGNLTVSDYRAVEFYDNADKAPEWYKYAAFEPPTTRAQAGRARTAGQPMSDPSRMGRPCALVVYWTRFSPTFDPGLDQSPSVTRNRAAFIDSVAKAKGVKPPV